MATKTQKKNGDVWETFGNSILLLSYLVVICKYTNTTKINLRNIVNAKAFRHIKWCNILLQIVDIILLIS